MQFPVSIELRRSFLLIIAVCAMHAMAAGAIFLTPVNGWLRLASLVVVAISLRLALRPSRISSLHLGRDGGLDCGLSDGTRASATVLTGTTVFPSLVVLRLRIDEQRGAVSLSLLRDHMSGDEFRILRLWLRWSAISASGPEPIS